MNYSHFEFIGHVTREPELRATQGGTQVCNVGIAVNHRYGDKDETAFFWLTAFGKQAEAINQHVRKGRLMHFAGRISQSRWQDKDDKPQQKTEFIVSQFNFLEKKDSAPSSGEQRAYVKEEPVKANHLSDDLPF